MNQPRYLPGGKAVIAETGAQVTVIGALYLGDAQYEWVYTLAFDKDGAKISLIDTDKLIDYVPPPAPPAPPARENNEKDIGRVKLLIDPEIRKGWKA